MLDDPVVLLRYVGPENCCSDLRVIVLRNDLTDVMEQCNEHGLVVSPVLIRPRRRLQRMLKAVDRAAVVG